MASPQPPVVYAAGDSFDVDRWATTAAWLVSLFERGITPDMLYRDANGDVVLNSDLNLQGRKLLGAANVPTGLINIKSLGVSSAGGFGHEEIQSALNRAASDGFSAVFMPPGIYTIDQALIIPNGMWIWGSGYQTEIVITDGSAPHGSTAFQFGGDSGRLSDVRIRSTVEGFNTGLRFTEGEGFSAQNLFVEDLYQGVAVSNSENIYLRAIWSKECDTALSVTDTTNLNVSQLRHIGHASRKGIGVTINGCLGAMIGGCNVEGALTGVALTGCHSSKLQCFVKESGKSGLALGSCTTTQVENSWFRDNSQESGVRAPGIDMSGCTACSVENCISVATSGAQTYGVIVAGGHSNKICGSILTPNFGPTGIGDPYDPNFRIKNESENTLIYGINPVIVSQPTSL